MYPYILTYFQIVEQITTLLRELYENIIRILLFCGDN